ncbi:MAG: DUF4296 domain-containing protein [Bacteroidales bacterium]|jgi:hypothetical protein
MKKYFFPTLLLFFLVTSCYKNHKEVSPKPESLLSKQQMVEILTSMQLIEGESVMKRDKLKDVQYAENKHTREVYKAFGITPNQLAENLDYYQDQPELMIEIFDEVLANLSKLQAEVKFKLDKKANLKKIKEDSIQGLNNLDFNHLPVFIRKVDVLSPKFNISDYFVKSATRDSVSIPLSSW